MTLFLSDRALLDQFRSGTAEGLGRVYDFYITEVEKVVRLGFNLDSHGGVRVPGLRDPHEHRDIVHDVFTRAFEPRARSAYDGLRPYRPYLLRIAKNRLIDHHRRRKRDFPNGFESVQDSTLDDATPLEEDFPLGEEFVHWRRLREATRDYVAKLGDLEKRFVELRFVEGFSQERVAETLSISRRRVRDLEVRQARSLRKHLLRLGFWDDAK